MRSLTFKLIVAFLLTSVLGIGLAAAKARRGNAPTAVTPAMPASSAVTTPTGSSPGGTRTNIIIAGALVGLFLCIDLPFLSANMVKITHGGWLPLVVGAAVFTVFVTWKRGRELLADEMRRRVSELVGPQPVEMGTFHRFAARLLRRHARLAAVTLGVTAGNLQSRRLVAHQPHVVGAPAQPSGHGERGRHKNGPHGQWLQALDFLPGGLFHMGPDPDR